MQVARLSPGLFDAGAQSGELELITEGLNDNDRMLRIRSVLPIGPTGDDFVFGDQGVTYSRLQAGLAIGFRLGTDSFLTPPGVLLGEPDLKVLIEPLGVHIASILVPFFGIFIPSDERIKTNITDMNSTEAIQNVMAMSPKTYYYTDTWHEMLGEDTQDSRGSKRRGFIAQDIEKILPHSVKKTTVNLDGEIIDDFRDLRKEDLITEVVSAFQDFYYDSIVESAHNLLRRDPFGGSSSDEGSKRQTPWDEEIKRCIALTSRRTKSICVCGFIHEFCAQNPTVLVCELGHPLRTRCANIPVP